MILVWGSQDDTPVARVLEALEVRGADIYHVAESALENLKYDIVFSASSPSGWIESGGRRVAVDEFRGIYLRPGEHVADNAQNAAMVLLAIAGSLPSVVVNRPTAGRSNTSKPYKAALSREPASRCQTPLPPQIQSPRARFCGSIAVWFTSRSAEFRALSQRWI